MQDSALVVRAEWDDEARVWVVESDDIPGLVAEAEGREDLVKKLSILIPEMLELNGHLLPKPIKLTKPLEIVVQFHQEERISLPVAA
jgi:predicted RNase H-like HicB family nuclease